MALPAAKPVVVAPQRRMTLTAIQSSRKVVADKILMSGTPGVGKSTFAADAPRPIFIAAEEGLSQINAEAFPEPQSFAEILEAVRTLTDETHDFKTLVLDSIDWIEPLIWADLCRANKWEGIETPPYGRGYTATTDEWRKLIAMLDRLRAAKGMEIILLAHVTLKMFSNPSGADFSRMEIKLHRGASALLQEWSMVHLFACHEEFVTKEKGAAKAKATSTGRRIMHTQRTATWDAKNRYGLPPVLPLSYEAYADARAAGQVADPDALRAEAESLRDELAPAPETLAKINASIESATGNSATLAKIVNRLRSLVAEKGQD